MIMLFPHVVLIFLFIYIFVLIYLALGVGYHVMLEYPTIVMLQGLYLSIVPIKMKGILWNIFEQVSLSQFSGACQARVSFYNSPFLVSCP